MKILVLSDSHGQFSAMEDAVLRERPDYIFHLGDHQRDARKLGKRFPDYPVISVPGNCDLPLPTETLTVRQELGGVSMLLTHGHAYGVKGGLLRMELTFSPEDGETVAERAAPLCLQRGAVFMGVFSSAGDRSRPATSPPPDQV